MREEIEQLKAEINQLENRIDENLSRTGQSKEDSNEMNRAFVQHLKDVKTLGNLLVKVGNKLNKYFED